ncbi:MAG: sulfite exporter TauE/SafE family protein [Gammaproteobacteria bacterium]|nr:sulfite exporter TauE/SafE family protein [Gammaproteobacteria bacterium]
MDSYGLMLAALITGFLGSLHCVGMCGAIACSRMLFVGPKKRINVDSEILQDAAANPIYSLVFNMSRILMYAILGAVLAFIGQQIVLTTRLELVAKIFRISGAVLIALIGLRFLINLHWVDKIEKVGLLIWSKLKLWRLNTSARQNPDITRHASFHRVIMLGMLWGLIPCALVYTMLLTATVSGTVSQGAGIMFAFGLGTLPAMQGMSMFGESVRLFARKGWLRQAFGVALIIIAVYVFIINVSMDTMHIGHQM